MRVSSEKAFSCGAAWAIALAISSPVQAAQIIQKVEVYGFSTTGPFTVNRFDPGLGTLTGVSGSLVYGGSGLVFASGPPGAFFSYGGTLSMDLTSDSPLAFSLSGPLLGFGALGNSGSATVGFTASLTGDYTAGQSDIAAFYGTNPISGLFQKSENFTVNVGGGSGSANFLFPLGNLTLTYDYVERASASPVPEPTAWGMMISGFGLVAWALRRRATKRAAQNTELLFAIIA